MIIACPACTTRYVVPDSAVGVDGRTVRCAKCRHSWFQEGPELVPRPEAAPQQAPPDASPPPATPPASAPPAADNERFEYPDAETNPAPADEGFAHDPDGPDSTETPLPQNDQGVAEEIPDPPEFASHANTAQTFTETLANVPGHDAPGYDSSEYDDNFSQFDHEPPFRPRRNRLKILTIAATLFALLALGTVGAVSYWGLPDWIPVSRPTFALAQPDLVLDFPATKQDRRTLPNGTEFFGASGTVTNVGKTTRNLPSILIVLRDERDRIVYSWEVAPPKRSLAPGEGVTINEAVTDVPRSAKFAEIGWKPE